MKDIIVSFLVAGLIVASFALTWPWIAFAIKHLNYVYQPYVEYVLSL